MISNIPLEVRKGLRSMKRERRITLNIINRKIICVNYERDVKDEKN